MRAVTFASIAWDDIREHRARANGCAHLHYKRRPVIRFDATAEIACQLQRRRIAAQDLGFAPLNTQLAGALHQSAHQTSSETGAPPVFMDGNCDLGAAVLTGINVLSEPNHPQARSWDGCVHWR